MKSRHKMQLHLRPRSRLLPPTLLLLKAMSAKRAAAMAAVVSR
jgi:hypothetical protein